MLSHVAVTDYLRAAGCQIIPTCYAHALPGGRLDLTGFQTMLSELLARIPDQAVDGVWLYLHGALEVEGIGSGDVAIVSAVRARVGSSVPIALALDFHANLDERIATLADIICAYRTAPHTDMAETELRAARLLVESINRREKPCCALVRVPLILTGDKVLTAVEPMRSIIQACLEIGQMPGLLDAAVFNGQPWVDAPQTGASALVVARRAADLALARQQAAYLAGLLWRARDQYAFQAVAVEAATAVRAALARADRPILISDSGDNVTAGAPGDRVDLLRVLLDQAPQDCLLAGLTAPDTVARARDCPIGRPLRFDASAGDQFGRLMGDMGLQPVVRRHCQMLGWYGEDGGPAVVLALPGLDLIVTERRCAVISPAIIAATGLSIADYRVIAVKLGYLFPELADIAAGAYLALTPGASCEVIEALPYRQITRPVYPLDHDFDWQPERA
jgi:microcystin degradation protein MlrC